MPNNKPWSERLGISNLPEDESYQRHLIDRRYRASVAAYARSMLAEGERARLLAGYDALKYRRETAPQERPKVVYDLGRDEGTFVEANLTISSARGHGEMLDLIEQMERLMLAGIRHFTVRVED